MAEPPHPMAPVGEARTPPAMVGRDRGNIVARFLINAALRFPLLTILAVLILGTLAYLEFAESRFLILLRPYELTANLNPIEVRPAALFLYFFLASIFIFAAICETIDRSVTFVRFGTFTNTFLVIGPSVWWSLYVDITVSLAAWIGMTAEQPSLFSLPPLTGHWIAYFFAVVWGWGAVLRSRFLDLVRWLRRRRSGAM